MTQVLDNYNIKELTGKNGLVIFFFPRAKSADCSIEIEVFNHKLKDIQNLGFNVVGISTDKKEANEEFAKAHDLNYPLISDEHKTITKQFNDLTTVIRDGKEIERALRTTYLVDPSGKILATLPDVNAITAASDTINKIKELQES
ncbi:redoxin domain-containing protein [Mesoplasma lactucae]|uniref:Thioredoxin domain-containing protein n=1 Tax=Mesoplasma lactucae ATCC 49193 TaxID=81460 RepID=A0A291IRN8_9MOLU|nr:redoxin domain-containing protein [Mesoplasma lactucae]ATG97414.1 hypothetical protein CP520_01405 [Mesoplasma lactucae ATCC 49193]ATZ20133.1 peroxiredoxin [Mesoplasma lactucae ATCC 49193]MCL8216881.1 putative peroxiredoxin [Mesoplasma lactucae ATCC 49193]